MPNKKGQNAMTHYSDKLSLPAFDLLCALRNGGRHEQVDMCSRGRNLGGSTTLTEKPERGTSELLGLTFASDRIANSDSLTFS